MSTLIDHYALFDDVLAVAKKAHAPTAAWRAICVRAQRSIGKKVVQPIAMLDLGEEIPSLAERVRSIAKKAPSEIDTLVFGLFDGIDDDGAGVYTGFHLGGAAGFDPEARWLLKKLDWLPEDRFLKSPSLDAIMRASVTARGESKKAVAHALRFGAAALLGRFACAEANLPYRVVITFDDGDFAEISSGITPPTKTSSDPSPHPHRRILRSRNGITDVMKRVASATIAIVFLAVLLASCSKSKPSSTKATDGAQRIVSLSPSTTEAVFAIGAGVKMVGRSRYCDYPPEVLKLPQVGGYVDPSFEAILALRPDLVVGARGPAGSAMAEKLEARGIATYFPPTESFAAIDDMILGVGERVARSGDAKSQVDSLHGRIASIERSVASLPKTRVLLVFGLSPLSVAGPSSFADEMIRRAGGANVIVEGGAYPTIGAERVLALDPDVVINAAMMEERASERLKKGAPGWLGVRAIENGKVTSITNEAILRPGPRIAEGLALLARALHPDVKKIDAPPPP